MTNKIYLFLKNNFIYIFLFLITLLHVFIRNVYLSYFLITLQVFLLGYLFINKRYVDYLYSLLLFTFFTFELDYYVTPLTIVDFKSININAISLPNICLLPLLILILCNLKKVTHKLLSIKYGKIIIFLFSLQLMSLFVGMINIVFNIAGIATHENIISLIITQLYSNYFLVIAPLLCSLYILDKKNYKKFYQLVSKSLLMIVFFALVTLSFGVHGNYGGQQTIIAPNLIVFTPILLLISNSYEKYKKYIYLFGGGMGIAINLISPIMSKSFLIIGITCIFYFFIQFKKSKNKKIFIITSMCILFIVSVIMFYSLNSNELYKWKTSQFMGLINVFDKNWFANLDMSPKVRIVELIDITASYIKNPISLLFGKGFLGMYLDITGFFQTIPENLVETSFTFWEWSNGVYFTTHETITKFYLCFGIFGIMFIVYFFVLTLKNVLKSPISVVLFFSFIFFYGYSTTYCYLAMISFVIFIFELNEHKEENGVLIVDLWGSVAHKRLNIDCINMISSFSKCIVLNPNGLFNEIISKNIKLENINLNNKSTNSIMNRFRYLFNISKIYFKTLKYYNEYDKVFVLCYEQITFNLFYFLFSTKKMYLYQHQHIDWLNNKIIAYFFSFYCNNVHHIVLEEIFMNSLINLAHISNKNLVHTIHHPCHNLQMITPKKENHFFLGISSSNDENIVLDILDLERKEHFFEKNNIKILLRSKLYQFDNGFLKIENVHYSDNELDELYKSSDATLILVRHSEFENRVSGSIFDSISKGTPIISINIPIIVELSKNNPNYIKSFSNMIELQSVILEGFNYDNYCSEVKKLQLKYCKDTITSEFNEIFQ